MASKSAQPEPEKAEVIEEALDALDDALDRLKVLYEQYFLGIQKQPPQFVHIEVERKLRDLAQLNIRNTALRYRFVTLQQKFGSYNTYWRRTLREIEAGRYIRSLSKITRQAAATGAEIPYEILAAMPRRMREQVRRDREAALAVQRRRRGVQGATDEAELLTLVPLDGEGGAGYGGHGDGDDEGEGEGFVRESTDVRQLALRARGGAHVLDESDGELDLDAFFREVEGGAAAAAPSSAAPRPAAAVAAAAPKPVATPALKIPPIAPSQQTRPNPIAPGSSSALPPVSAEVMAGPFPRSSPTATPPRPLPSIATPPRPPPPPTVTPPTSTPPRPSPTVTPPTSTPPRPSPTVTPPKPPPIVAPPRPPPPIAPPDARPVAPPGMSETDVTALYAKYAKAKEAIGQTPNPGSFNRLMRTLHAQTPKILEQYQAKGVDFTVAIQDGQVIIRAKPKL